MQEIEGGFFFWADVFGGEVCVCPFPGRGFKRAVAGFDVGICARLLALRVEDADGGGVDGLFVLGEGGGVFV